MSHICTQCFQPVERHMDCGEDWPTCCCEGCGCGTWEEKHNGPMVLSGPPGDLYLVPAPTAPEADG